MRIWQKNAHSAAIHSLVISLKMQLMWLYILFGKQFEDSLVNAHLATIKQMHLVHLFIF